MSIAGVDDTEWEESHAATFMAPKEYVACCSGPCNQGRKLCPTPEACQRATDEKARSSIDAFCGGSDKLYQRIGLLIVASSGVAVVAGIVQFFKWWLS